MLQPSSMRSFAELCKQFMSQFVDGRRGRVPVAYLLTLKQKDREALKEYMACFNKKRLLVEGQDDKVVLVALLGRI